MTVPVLLIEPTKSGLSNRFKATGTMTETEGGRPRLRKTVIGATKVFDLEFIVTSSKYQYFLDFYELELEEGNLPFEVTLISDGFGKAAHVGIIVPGSVSTPRFAGKTYIFTCQFDGDKKEKFDIDTRRALLVLTANIEAELEDYCDLFLSVERAVNTLAPEIKVSASTLFILQDINFRAELDPYFDVPFNSTGINDIMLDVEVALNVIAPTI